MKPKNYFFIKLFILLALIYSKGYASQSLPDLGDYSQSILSHQEEKELTQEFRAFIYTQLPLLSDAASNAYIQQLGDRLVAASPAAKQKFHFFIVNDSAINAFAGPGGYIGINSGLIARAKSESEVASVMAHEIAHVTQHHVMRMMADQKKMQLPTLGAVLASIALSTQSPQAGLGMLSASVAGAYQHAINFTRDNEREADNIGMEILSKAGFNPNSMPSFFERLASSNRLNADDAPPLLRTHPVTIERIAEAKNRAMQYASHEYLAANPDFFLIQARVIAALSNGSIEANRYYETELTQQKTLTAKYLLVLSLASANQYQKAYAIISELVKEAPAQRLFKLTQANILASMGKYTESAALFNTLHQEYPADYAIAFEQAKLLVNIKQSQKALAILNAQIGHREDPDFLDLLALAQGRAGYLCEAFQTRAKLYLFVGDQKGALSQLSLALKQAKDENMRRKIQTKIQELEKEMKR